MSSSDFSVHGQGGSQFEVFVLNVIPPLSILIRNLLVPWVSQGHQFDTHGVSYWWKFLLDFILIALPVAGSMTIFANHLEYMVIAMLVVVLMMVLFMVMEYHMVSKERLNTRLIMNRIIEEHHSPTKFLTYFRSSVLLSVLVAILAVDFRVFPRRFAKTENYGHSQMDVGVTAFICCNAMVKPLKTTLRREENETRNVNRRFPLLYSPTFALVVLGIARTVVMELLQYPHEVTEYGLHWNFFYTLAVVTVVSRVLPAQFSIVTALVFSIVHQTILFNGIQEWVMDPAAARDDLVSANKEGIYSLLGYLALFYFSRAIGRFISKTGLRLKSWALCCVHLLVISAVFRLLQIPAESLAGPHSRKLVNLSFIFAQMSLFCFFASLHLMVQVAAYIAWAAKIPHCGSDENPFAKIEPCIMGAINKHGFAFFLLANLATGAVNMVAPSLFGVGASHELCSEVAVSILVLYSLFCCAFAHFLNSRRSPSQNPSGNNHSFN